MPPPLAAPQSAESWAGSAGAGTREAEAGRPGGQDSQTEEPGAGTSPARLAPAPAAWAPLGGARGFATTRESAPGPEQKAAWCEGARGERECAAGIAWHRAWCGWAEVLGPRALGSARLARVVFGETWTGAGSVVARPRPAEPGAPPASRAPGTPASDVTAGSEIGVERAAGSAAVLCPRFSSSPTPTSSQNSVTSTRATRPGPSCGAGTRTAAVPGPAPCAPGRGLFAVRKWILECLT